MRFLLRDRRLRQHGEFGGGREAGLEPGSDSRRVLPYGILCRHLFCYPLRYGVMARLNFPGADPLSFQVSVLPRVQINFGLHDLSHVISPPSRVRARSPPMGGRLAVILGAPSSLPLLTPIPSKALLRL